MTIFSEGVELEIVWTGAHEGRDKDLFNPVETTAVVLPSKRSRISRRETARGDLLDLMAERSIWSTTDLYQESGLSDTDFWNALRYFRQRGITSSPERGMVSLIRDIAA